MTLIPVTHGREGGKQTKKSPTENHPLSVCYLVGESHGDEGDTGYQIADIKEKKTSEKRICGSQNFSRFLSCPDGPESRAEIPDGLHGATLFLWQYQPCLARLY